MAVKSNPNGVTITPIKSSNLQTQTFEGSPGGMNLAVAQQEIPDHQARYIQDGLVDYPGLTRRRGPVTAVSGAATLSYKVTSFAMTLNPQGTDKYGVLNGNNSNGYFTVLNDALTATQADLTWPHALPTDPGSGAATAYRITDIKPALGGGLLLGVSSAYDANSPNQGLAVWRGGNRANYTNTGINLTRGSAAVTCASGFSGNVVPGMFLFCNTDDPYTSAYIGVVLSVNSDTSITLEQASPYTATAKSGTFQSLRGLAPKVVKGRITCDTSSTTVTGGATEFSSQGLGTGTWQIYRQSDMAFVGKVSAVNSDTSITLTANAAVACSDQSYIAVRADADYSITTTANVNKVGFLSSTYSGRQWYANNGAQYAKTSRVWFSDPSDFEALDLSAFNGDWLDIPSSSGVNTPIKALAPSQNALLIFKENETFALYGSTPSQFSVKKLEDDGALSGMSVQQYGGGVIWAGREGVHYYDGIQTQNITQGSLGDYWKNTIRTFDPSRYRMWSMINRDHYLLFIENIIPTLALIKGNVSHTPTRYTIAINMVSGAVTILTNLNFRGHVVLPASAGKKIWYVVNGSSIGYICDGEALFNTEGVDGIACDGGTAGPDFFYESKKFALGDSLRVKRFKHLSCHYLVQGGDIKIDSVLGLNNVGQQLTSVFPASVLTWTQLAQLLFNWTDCGEQYPTWTDVVQSVFVPEKVKFQKVSQHLSFRLYQSTSAITRLQLGPFQLGYKVMRPGRVK